MGGEQDGEQDLVTLHPTQIRRGSLDSSHIYLYVWNVEIRKGEGMYTGMVVVACVMWKEEGDESGQRSTTQLG